jgi:hypothetical protein
MRVRRAVVIKDSVNVKGKPVGAYEKLGFNASKAG